MKAHGKLQPKHHKALKLIEQGNKPYKEIAQECGFSKWSFYDLVQGKESKMGKVAVLFKAELEKIQRKSQEKIKQLLVDNKVLALEKLNERLHKLRQIGPKTTKEITSMMNAMGKMAPNINIEQFNYNKGLSAEDLVNEFKKLKTIASGSSDGGRVQETRETSAREVSGASEAGSSVQAE